MFGILTVSVILGSFMFFLQEEYKRQIFFNDKVISSFDVRWSIFFSEYIWYVFVFYLFGGIQTSILGILLGKANKQSISIAQITLKPRFIIYRVTNEH